MSDDLYYFHRYFNVIGSDPEGRLGEAPKPELREHGRISGACFDAARGVIPGLQVNKTHSPLKTLSILLLYSPLITEKMDSNRSKEQTTKQEMELVFVTT